MPMELAIGYVQERLRRGQKSTHGTRLGPVYTKRQRQGCDNSVMTLAILFSLKSVESLENRLQPHSGATPLFLMRTESQASSALMLTLGVNGPLRLSIF